LLWDRSWPTPAANWPLCRNMCGSTRPR
jgi:hypothetical protein